MIFLPLKKIGLYRQFLDDAARLHFCDYIHQCREAIAATEIQELNNQQILALTRDMLKCQDALGTLDDPSDDGQKP